MRKITLFCAMGMSTSLMVEKMKKTAQLENYECDINAYPISDVERLIIGSDIVYLGPQVRYNMAKLKERYPDIKIKDIDMRIYGKMDGEALIHDAKKELGD